MRIKTWLGVSLLALSLCGTRAFGADSVSFGTDWLAEPEQGGYYQAVVDGTYTKYGLDVKIIQGGPNAANSALLIAGKIDFYIGSPLEELTSAENGVPMVDVAAIFQKDPQVLIVHPDQGIEKFSDLAKLPVLFLSKDGYLTFFEWMKGSNLGFRDEQFKPYNFDSAPFIADKKSAVQGFLTSEPYAIEQSSGIKPKVFLLADEGYKPYSTMITTRREIIEKNPQLVQRFVDATIEGWYNYLYGDNTKANEVIKRDNPEMTDGQIAYSIAKMKEYGIVVSGEAETKGIGCMTTEKYQAFADLMKKFKVIAPSTDVSKAYTTQFVCKGVGMSLKK